VTSSPPIYLDGFATTPLAPEAAAAMQAAWREPLNAGSPHRGGARASALLEAGRASVANLINALPAEIIFTSGATESDNLAIRGVADWALAGGSQRRRIIVSAIEHKAVLETARLLGAAGFEVILAPVTSQGVVDQDRLAELIDEGTLLVSLMQVNNETGVIQPVKSVCALSHARGALFHCDAAQAVGKIEVDVLDLGVDYLSLSSHKMYGPVGVGGLYIAAAAPRPAPLANGGGQERGLRSGTVPIPLVAGFGEAARIAAERRVDDAERLTRQEALLLQSLRRHGLRFQISSGEAKRLSGALSIIIEGRDADDIVDRIGRNVSLSTGSACTSGQVTPSHVLIAMGIPANIARSAVRLYIDRFKTDADLEAAAEHLAAIAAVT
jgi:cysteine desulfurase